MSSSREEFLMNMCASRLFHGMSLEEMDSFLSLAEARHHVAGQMVIKESDKGGKFFWVETGRLEVQVLGVNSERASKKIPVHYLKPGDLFGELALLGIEKRTASVISIDATRLFRWDANECLNYFKNNKDVGYKIMFNLACILGTRVRDMNLMIRNYADALGPDTVKFI